MKKLIVIVAAAYGLLTVVLRITYNRLQAIEQADPDTRRWWTTRDFVAEEQTPLTKKDDLFMSRYNDDEPSI